MRSDTIGTIRPVAGHDSGAGAHGAFHTVTLGLVWLTFLTSGIVFAEPAPVDLMLMGLVLLLPLVGLVVVSQALTGYLVLWLGIVATGFLAAPFAADDARAASHTAVTLYLAIASFVLAGFIARNAADHARIVLGGVVWAGLVATVAGLVGYFDLLPGAADVFTRFGRASGTFKDPNVYGAFLVLPAVYCLHLAIERPLRRAIWPLAGFAVLALGILLSFSRGAWINLAIAVVSFGYLAFSTSASPGARLRIAAFALAGVAAMGLVGILALQNESIAGLMSERATLTQSYDVGPEGRFGGQEKALRLISENPLGIGAQDFTQSHHHEEVHNVYLSMTLNGGWIGGVLFIVLNALTVVVGTSAMLSNATLRPLLIVAVTVFTATALEGVIIDTDHWRHYYIELALVWGLATAARTAPSRISAIARGAR